MSNAKCFNLYHKQYDSVFNANTNHIDLWKWRENSIGKEKGFPSNGLNQQQSTINKKEIKNK